MPQGPMSSPLMRPLVVLALPGMYLFYKYNQYKRRQQESARRRLTERELQHLNHKIVSLLGADCETAQHLALHLKQSNCVTDVALCCDSNEEQVQHLVSDLFEINTSCNVTSHCSRFCIHQALQDSKLVVIFGEREYELMKLDPEVALRLAAPRLKKLTTWCTESCNPNVMIIVNARPVAITTAFVIETLKQKAAYSPGLVVGSCALAQCRANSVVANNLDIDPSVVHVPIVGGPEFSSIIPILSAATPTMAIRQADADGIIRDIQFGDMDVLENKPDSQSDICPLRESHALAQFLMMVIAGLNGKSLAMATTFIRSTLLPTCSLLTSEVEFTPRGVTQLRELPRLSHAEQMALFYATSDIQRQVNAGLNYQVPSQETSRSSAAECCQM